MTRFDDLGYEGLVLIGKTPQEAWQIIRDDTMGKADIRPLIEHLASSPEGLAVLQRSRDDWAARGFPPPWAELLNQEPPWTALMPEGPDA